MPDTSYADLDEALSRFNAIVSWTSEKHQLRKKLSDIAKQLGTFRFKGRADFFHLNRLPHVGESSLYDVPSDHRGKLKAFCGKTVRVICIGNVGRSDRELIAYEIQK